MNYAEYQREHRRLAILRMLNETPGRSANESLVAQVLLHLGLKASRDTVRADLAWLAEQGLVKSSEYAGVTVAEITRRGAETATGVVEVPGVQVPSPEA